MWKHTEKQWVLKIADQKFLGHPRLDKRGEIYWKFKNWEEKEGVRSEPNSENDLPPSHLTATLKEGEVKVELLKPCEDSTCPLNPCPLKENVNSQSNSEANSLNSDHPDSPK